MFPMVKELRKKVVVKVQAWMIRFPQNLYHGVRDGRTTSSIWKRIHTIRQNTGLKMWKSLCVAFIFLYFIPSSDTAGDGDPCNYCTVQNYFNKPENTKGLEIYGPESFAIDLSDVKLPGNSVTVKRLTLNRTDVAFISKDYKTFQLILYLFFYIDAVINLPVITTLPAALLPRPTLLTNPTTLATITGTFQATVTVAYNESGTFVYLGAEKAGGGQLKVTLLSGVSYVVGGACHFKEFFLLKWSDQIENRYKTFVENLNKGSLKDTCSKGIQQCAMTGQTTQASGPGTQPSSSRA